MMKCRAMSLAVALPFALMSPACAPRETPVVRACLQVTGAGGSGRERCRCVDGVLRRQLDDPSYAALSGIAEAKADRPAWVAVREGARSLASYWRRTSGADATLAGADLALAMAKAGLRCP